MMIEFSVSEGSILLMKEKVKPEIITQHTTVVTGYVVTVDKGVSFGLTKYAECVRGPKDEHRPISLPPVKSKDCDMQDCISCYISSLCRPTKEQQLNS